ncbi:DUF4383 domain-containing protein [Bdellovibrio reynosensis]|uniref:DUF4383 domain-containing protein n=1 Tax=Bdellovibrio reynosensis TaxID=2835041 RepID=A0ABY4C8E3_9BACT|nr:DUF4383 domain-containing protein [Bdellovibrio reynosensis]UOF01253.1 DUF4383 domain-containing protein [Bdellovibrio reynosensis]
MELEREPRRKPTIPPQAQRPEPSISRAYKPAASTQVAAPTKKSYAQEVCVVLGASSVVIGLIGFVADNFLGAHLSYTHNVIHVVSGAAAMWFGFDSLANARRFSVIFGAIYGALGLLGFIIGTSGIPSHGAIHPDRFLWKPAPEVLEFGTSDHILHLLIAGAFLIGAMVSFKRRIPKT